MGRAPRPPLSAAVLLGQGLRARPIETRPLRILVAVSEPHRRHCLLDTLRAGGEEALPATGWVEAVNALATTPFDALLYALDLPHAGGLAAARGLRAWPPPVCDMAVLALTGEGARMQDKDWRDAGLDALLHWPAALEGLPARLRAVVASVTPPPPLDAALRTALLAEYGPEALAERDGAALRAAGAAMAALRAAETQDAALAAAGAIIAACETLGAPVAAAAARRAGAEFPRGQAELMSALAAAGTAIRMAGRRR
jgi:CheY-like chemotaxis protein